MFNQLHILREGLSGYTRVRFIAFSISVFFLGIYQYLYHSVIAVTTAEMFSRNNLESLIYKF